MHPITIHTEGGAPSFDADPIAWFSWARQRLRDGSHERVGRTQVDPHRQTTLVGCRRHAGLGNLQ